MKEFECLDTEIFPGKELWHLVKPKQSGQDLEINDDTSLFIAHNILCCIFKDPVTHDTCQIIGTVQCAMEYMISLEIKQN